MSDTIAFKGMEVTIVNLNTTSVIQVLVLMEEHVKIWWQAIDVTVVLAIMVAGVK